MRIPCSNRISHRLGFSLIELLLTTLLILLLLAAVAFNFSPWQKEASLREGIEQFQAALHLARAQAAETGRNVLVRFNSNTNGLSSWTRAGIEMLWEPSPLIEPGSYQTLRVPGWDVAGLNELVSVVNVWDLRRAPTAGNSRPGTGAPVPSDSASIDSSSELAPSPEAWPVLHFYPDGSSDSAEIELASRDERGSTRHAIVRLVGITGSISYRWLEVNEFGLPEEEETSPPQPGEEEPAPESSDSHESVSEPSQPQPR